MVDRITDRVGRGDMILISKTVLIKSQEVLVMKRILVLSLAFAWIGTVWANEVSRHEVASKISSVTVYSDRAMVKRAFTAELPAGFVSIAILNLPSRLLDESVRVTGKGTSGATISGVNIEETYLESSAQDAVRELEERKDKIDDRIRVLQDRKGVLGQKKGFIESLSQKTSESIAENIAVQRPSIEEWTAMVSFIDKSLNEISTETQAIDKEWIDLKNKKAVLAKEMAKYQNSSGESRKSVQVDLELDNPGSITMELSYIVMGANWTPIYDIRASSDNDTISVIFMANVRQNTGEDWNDVQLELSTAKPFLGAAPRDLNPWYLEVAEHGSLRGLARGGRGEIAYRVDGIDIKDKLVQVPWEAPAVMKQILETQLSVADVSHQLISTSFTLKQSESIPSDNTAKKVSVKVASAVGKKEYYAVPKLNNYAYLGSMVTNQTNFPLLPGNANVFFDGSFVSTTTIPLVVPSESFEMYLGIDEGIKLKRELVKKFSDKAGVISRKNRVEYSYKITVETYRDFEQKITILDQIPVSQDDRIDIKVKKIVPEPRYKGDDKQKGILRWIVNLPPRGKETISFDYQILYPPDVIIAGLN